MVATKWKEYETPILHMSPLMHVFETLTHCQEPIAVFPFSHWAYPLTLVFPRVLGISWFDHLFEFRIKIKNIRIEHKPRNHLTKSGERRAQVKCCIAGITVSADRSGFSHAQTTPLATAIKTRHVILLRRQDPSTTKGNAAPLGATALPGQHGELEGK